MSFLKYHLPLLIYAGLIFFVSSLPNLTSPMPVFHWSDKVIHFVEFALLGILIWRSAGHWNIKVRKVWLVLLAITIGFAYAASDELHQSFVPGRNADIFDWVADSIGLSIGVIMAMLIAKNGVKTNSEHKVDIKR